VWVGPDVAVAVTVALWSLRVLANGLLANAPRLLDLVHAAWSTNLVTGAATVVLLAVATIIAGRGEPVRGSRATYLV